jgi:hypothetical protein
MSDVKAKASRKTRAKLVAPLSSQPATPPSAERLAKIGRRTQADPVWRQP